ncbi:hypothetical protein [Streptomyces sp. CC228A]|uniref:hypothetical protein n=1 Tax=Streptomyces sp. CC228A TaxID=2898186 RepID=UPI001F2214ED|nr:hypothetical protein [Streptomyces sp. CC228A]
MGAGAGHTGIRAAARTLAVLVAAGLALTGPGAVTADAAALAGCSGRLAKTARFAGGELRVYKSRQYACAVTVAAKPGVRRSMSVTLQPRGGRAVTDKGRFTHQAGPVTVHALNRCVRASASIAGKKTATGWILC